MLPQIVLRDTAKAAHIQIGQHGVEVLAQTWLGHFDRVLVEPLAVTFVHQAVVVDAVDLVDPEPLHGINVLAAFAVTQANAFFINEKLIKNNMQNWFGYFVWLEFIKFIWEFILINLRIHL